MYAEAEYSQAQWEGKPNTLKGIVRFNYFICHSFIISMITPNYIWAINGQRQEKKLQRSSSSVNHGDTRSKFLQSEKYNFRFHQGSGVMSIKFWLFFPGGVLSNDAEEESGLEPRWMTANAGPLWFLSSSLHSHSLMKLREADDTNRRALIVAGQDTSVLCTTATV